MTKKVIIGLVVTPVVLLVIAVIALGIQVVSKDITQKSLLKSAAEQMETPTGYTITKTGYVGVVKGFASGSYYYVVYESTSTRAYVEDLTAELQKLGYTTQENNPFKLTGTFRGQDIKISINDRSDTVLEVHWDILAL